jgi:hypothetical protein
MFYFIYLLIKFVYCILFENNLNFDGLNRLMNILMSLFFKAQFYGENSKKVRFYSLLRIKLFFYIFYLFLIFSIYSNKCLLYKNNINQNYFNLPLNY